MTNKPKLNDLQLIMLATAVQRDDGSLLPPPESLGDQAERIRDAIPALLRRKLVEELSVSDRTRAWREEDDQLIGLAITTAGRAIIAVEEDEEASALEETKAPVPTNVLRAGSKIEHVLNLLRRAEGATLTELEEATGWLPHTIRAALTGLRKKGHVIDKNLRDGATCYCVGEAA